MRCALNPILGVGYPVTPLKGAPRLRAHAPLNGITLHAPLTYRKVEASSPRIRVTNQVRFTLFAANVPKWYTQFSLWYTFVTWHNVCRVLLVNSYLVFPFSNQCAVSFSSEIYQCVSVKMCVSGLEIVILKHQVGYPDPKNINLRPSTYTYFRDPYY